MSWLSDGGFVRWRFDLVLGYASSFTKIYMHNTKLEFSVGEFLEATMGSDGKPLTNQDPHRAKLVRWVQDAGGAVTNFDFTTKMVLEAAVQGELWRMKDANGKPPGMIGTDPSHAVTLIDNHDTWSQKTWPFPQEKVTLGYAYILTLTQALLPFSTITTSASAARMLTLLVRFIPFLFLMSVNMAKIDNKIVVKIGRNGDLKKLLPQNAVLASSVQDFAVWELCRATDPPPFNSLSFSIPLQ